MIISYVTLACSKFHIHQFITLYNLVHAISCWHDVMNNVIQPDTWLFTEVEARSWLFHICATVKYHRVVAALLPYNGFSVDSRTKEAETGRVPRACGRTSYSVSLFRDKSYRFLVDYDSLVNHARCQPARSASPASAQPINRETKWKERGSTTVDGEDESAGLCPHCRSVRQRIKK